MMDLGMDMWKYYGITQDTRQAMAQSVKVRSKPEQTLKAIIHLLACLALVAAISMRPRLWPSGRFPTTVDTGLVLVTMLAAFHAARFSRVRLLFLLYGCLAGLLFMSLHMDSHGIGGLNYSGVDDWDMTRQCCILVVGTMLTCLYSAVLRHRLDDCKRPRPGYCLACGYNLTGNVTGICPECGERIR